MIATISLILAALSMVLFLLGPALAYFGVLPSETGFLMFGLGSILGIPAFISGAVMLGRSGPMPGAIVLVLGGIPALFLLYSVLNVRGSYIPRGT